MPKGGVVLCVWDPLDVGACKITDNQVRDAQSVLRVLLPRYAVKVVKATSLPLLNSSKVFSTRQVDIYQCGVFSIRALTQLVYNPEFDLGAQSLRNVRIWVAACLVQREISL